MYLIATATEQEMAPLRRRLAATPGWTGLVTGIGCLETAVTLSRFLAERRPPVNAIINCGVAGAFAGAGPGLLDLCLAGTEVQADLGIMLHDGVHPFDSLPVPTRFTMNPALRAIAETILAKAGRPFHTGTFVSVLAVSGTLARGEALRMQHQAICENMEGAAVARTAAEFSLPCLEIRAVSNMVEDRDVSAWRLAEAIERCADAVALLLPELPR